MQVPGPHCPESGMAVESAAWATPTLGWFWGRWSWGHFLRKLGLHFLGPRRVRPLWPLPPRKGFKSSTFTGAFSSRYKAQRPHPFHSGAEMSSNDESWKSELKKGTERCIKQFNQLFYWRPSQHCHCQSPGGTIQDAKFPIIIQPGSSFYFHLWMTRLIRVL